MAPRARFELAANRLTADCSTTELPRNTTWGRCLAPSLYHDHIKLTIAEDFFVSGAKGMATNTPKKNEAGCEPGPKALGNGGVSSRKTRGSCAAKVNNSLRILRKFHRPSK